MTAALLKKDWRVFLPAVIGCAVILPALYLVGTTSLLIGQKDLGPYELPRRIVAVALLGLGVTAVFGGVLGACAFAVERRDRSAEFLAMLPTTRGRIAASKALVAAACLLVLLAVNLAVLAGALPRAAFSADLTSSTHYAIAAIVSAAGMLFGVAWLCSATCRSTAIAFVVSLAVTLASIELVRAAVDRLDLRDYAFARIWIWGTGLTALASFVAGALCYLRRAEP